MNTQIFCLFITAGARIMPLQHQKKNSASTEAKIAGKDTCHPNCHLFDEHTNDVNTLSSHRCILLFFFMSGWGGKTPHHKTSVDLRFPSVCSKKVLGAIQATHTYLMRFWSVELEVALDVLYPGCNRAYRSLSSV